MTSLPNLANLRLKSLMMRKKKDEHEENPVENLLKPIKSLELESDCDSEISEISDVFEEFHKNSYLRPQSKHYLTKHEADIRTMAEFTDDFKRTISNIRVDLNIGKELLLENVSEIEQIFQKPNDTQIFPKITINKEITKKLDDTAYSVPSPAELRNMRKVSGTSTTSMVWQMLEANKKQNKFEISPPGFDTFKQQQPHWLQRASVSWSDIDQAKLKCENWLEQHCK